MDPQTQVPQVPQEEEKFNPDAYIDQHLSEIIECVYEVYNTVTKKTHTFNISVSLLSKMTEKEKEAAKLTRLNALIADKAGFEGQPRILKSESKPRVQKI